MEGTVGLCGGTETLSAPYDFFRIKVVRNLYFGEPEKFQLYNDSDSRKRVEAAGGKTIDFPDLADRVADDLVTKRLTIKRASEELPIGNRAELLRWRRLAHQALGEVLP